MKIRLACTFGRRKPLSKSRKTYKVFLKFIKYVLSTTVCLVLDQACGRYSQVGPFPTLGPPPESLCTPHRIPRGTAYTSLISSTGYTKSSFKCLMRAGSDLGRGWNRQGIHGVLSSPYIFGCSGT